MGQLTASIAHEVNQPIAAALGQGAVVVFNEDGSSPQILTLGSQLAAPWGVALAPAGFGLFGGDLLVGNFSFLNTKQPG
jgi:hypothetical protein